MKINLSSTMLIFILLVVNVAAVSRAVSNNYKYLYVGYANMHENQVAQQVDKQSEARAYQITYPPHFVNNNVEVLLSVQSIQLDMTSNFSGFALVQDPK